MAYLVKVLDTTRNKSTMKRMIMLAIMPLILGLAGCASTESQPTVGDTFDGDPARQSVRALYLELLNFKDDPRFHKMGFSVGSPYRTWFEEIRALAVKQISSESMPGSGIVPGDLEILGREYMSSKGAETRYTEIMRPEFDRALGVR